MRSITAAIIGFSVMLGCGPVADSGPKELTLYVSGTPQQGQQPAILEIRIATGSSVGSFTLPAYPRQLVRSLDGKRLYFAAAPISSTGPPGIYEFSTSSATARLVTSATSEPILAVSPDGRFIAAGGKLITIATGEAVSVGSGFVGAVFSLDSSKLYVAGSPYYAPGQQSGTYEITTGSFKPLPDAGPYGDLSVSLSPDGRLLALFATIIGKVEIHSTCDGSLVDAFSMQAANEMKWSGTTLVGISGRLVWQAHFNVIGSSCPPTVNHSLEQQLIPGVDVFYGTIAVAGSRAYIAGSDDLGAPFGYAVYDFDRNEISVHSTNIGSSYAVVVTSDGKTVYVSAADGIHVFDATTLNEILRIDTPFSPQFLVLGA